jgi:Chaperone of endosialidase
VSPRRAKFFASGIRRVYRSIAPATGYPGTLPLSSRICSLPLNIDNQEKINMTNFNPHLLMLSTALAIVADSSRAAQPPDVVDSDSNQNTAMGSFALGTMSSSAVDNTAAGYAALYLNTTGSFNTAFGDFALENNTISNGNTGLGYVALNLNTTGSSNTAVGSGALQSNTEGSSNTAVGNTALSSNTTGIDNTASGFQALYSNTTGTFNTAVGTTALFANTTGANNTAFGYQALVSNASGKGNAAQGVNALYSNTTGIRNLGIGSNALYTNSTGSYNIALGFDAGYNVVNGSNNIEIGAMGTAGDNGSIQIGAQGTQTSATIAGIYGTTITGSAVYVTPTGQLGVLASSERFKTDVEAMGAASEKLARLRPVTFKLKTDAKGTMQYGLIAEEVAKVYPELVIRGTDGRIDGVRYEELAPMLLNMVQRQQAKLAAQEERSVSLAKQMQDIQRRLAEVQHLKN